MPATRTLASWSSTRRPIWSRASGRPLVGHRRDRRARPLRHRLWLTARCARDAATPVQSHRFEPGSTAAPATSPDTTLPKGGTRGRMLRAKPPNVVGRGPLLGGPGFDVVIVCIVKDEADYLEEWLAYHVALGVDHFVIYDNGSTDGSARAAGALHQPRPGHPHRLAPRWRPAGGLQPRAAHVRGDVTLAGLLRRRRVPGAAAR